jgi:PPM family protein phosphatase
MLCLLQVGFGQMFTKVVLTSLHCAVIQPGRQQNPSHYGIGRPGAAKVPLRRCCSPGAKTAAPPAPVALVFFGIPNGWRLLARGRTAAEQRRVLFDETFLRGCVSVGLPGEVPVTARHVAVASKTGLVRSRNEDSAYAGRWLCAVADGMGGHAAGNVASATVVDAVRRFDTAAGTGQLTEVMGTAVRAANSQLAAASAGSRAGMGSTLTAMLWSGTHVAVAHIGDSRAYLLRGGSLRQITEDHVLSNLVAAPRPASISAYLVRFLDARPGWSPDLTLRTVQPGDRYLICSDGLSGFASHEAIAAVLTGGGDASQAADGLIALAYRAGAPDNVTVIVADLPDGAWRKRDGEPLVAGAAAELAGNP